MQADFRKKGEHPWNEPGVFPDTIKNNILLGVLFQVGYRLTYSGNGFGLLIGN
jgi:hypothetical protein